MKTEIQARNFPLTKALRNYVNRRLSFALSGRDSHILRVIVHLTDINGPRGGEDKCCHIQIQLARLPDVIIEDTETDMYVAIDRAANRVGRTVQRKLERKRDRDRLSRNLHLSESTLSINTQ